MQIALYQPDIPQNVGAIFRLSVCFATPVDIIEPCGFPLDDRRIKQVAMDYGGNVNVTRHRSWERFQEAYLGQRRVLLSTKATENYTDFSFRPDDILLLGRESAGVPEDVHTSADTLIRIPMAPEARSLNVAMAAAIVLGEARRQLAKLY